MAALGRTHAFIAGWALSLGFSCVVALNASAVTLVFRVTFPELVMRGALSVRFQFFAVVLMIVAVVVIVASMVIYYVAKRPELSQLSLSTLRRHQRLRPSSLLLRGPSWALILFRSWRASSIFRRRKR